MLGSLCFQVMRVMCLVPPVFLFQGTCRYSKIPTDRKFTSVIHVNSSVVSTICVNYMDYYCMWSLLGMGPVYKIRYFRDRVIEKLPRILQLQ